MLKAGGMVAAGRLGSESKRGSERLEVGNFSTYRSEIINEDTPLMDGQSNGSQSDGIDGFGALLPQRERVVSE